jgi:hypothetical protein
MIQHDNYNELEILYKKRLKQLEQNHPDTFIIICNLINIYRKQGNDADADILFKALVIVDNNNMMMMKGSYEYSDNQIGLDIDEDINYNTNNNTTNNTNNVTTTTNNNVTTNNTNDTTTNNTTTIDDIV